jgi:hypothetical protein
VGVLGAWEDPSSVDALKRMDGALLDGRDSMKMLDGLEKAASSASCIWPLRGVPGREHGGDGIRSLS